MMCVLMDLFIDTVKRLATGAWLSGSNAVFTVNRADEKADMKSFEDLTGRM